MSPLTVREYLMGHDLTYPLALTPDIEREAALTVELVNQLLDIAKLAGVSVDLSPKTKCCLSSGWRPPAYNATVQGAALNSKHMTGRAADIYDPDGDLDEWLMSFHGQATLTRLGLWMEHPAATKGWCHVQTVPPRSGNRVFYP